MGGGVYAVWMEYRGGKGGLLILKFYGGSGLFNEGGSLGSSR